MKKSVKTQFIICWPVRIIYWLILGLKRVDSLLIPKMRTLINQELFFSDNSAIFKDPSLKGTEWGVSKSAEIPNTSLKTRVPELDST